MPTCRCFVFLLLALFCNPHLFGMDGILCLQRLRKWFIGQPKWNAWAGLQLNWLLWVQSTQLLLLVWNWKWFTRYRFYFLVVPFWRCFWYVYSDLISVFPFLCTSPDGGEALSWGAVASGRLGHGLESSIFGFLTSNRLYFMFTWLLADITEPSAYPFLLFSFG